MSQSLFIWAVSCYLVCLSGSLLLSFFHKKFSLTALWVATGIHLMLLVAWFATKSPDDSLNQPGSSNYLFLLFFCSGILIAGTMLRKKVFVPIRVYFSIFILSAVLFAFNPSMVIGFIVSGNPRSIDPGAFNLYGNVFLMQQQSAPNPNQVSKTYKITREMGVFHMTLVRDIVLPLEPDSVEAAPLNDPAGVSVRFYFTDEGSRIELDSIFYFGKTRDSSRIVTRKIHNQTH